MKQGLVLICLLFLGGLLQAQAPVGDESEGAAEDAGGYVIGVEDILGIVVWGEPDLTMDVQVRPDGKITIPLLNDIYVLGETPESVGKKLGDRLETYVRAPSVTVIVRAINSYRVYFLGEINDQGAPQFYQPTRILQAIATSGGLTQFSKKEITLLRESNGVETRTRIDYKKLVAGDPAQPNLYLQPGDTLLFH